MPSDKRWSDAAVAGGVTAVGGAAAIGYGRASERQAADRSRLHARDLDAAESHLRDVKLMRDTGAPGPKAKMKDGSVRQLGWGGKIRHAEGRIDQAQKLRGAAEAKVAGARRVKRIGSGALGAGASLATLGAVMAERRRKPPKAAPVVARQEKAPAARPLKDYRSIVQDGIPPKMSPTAASDWLRANKDRA